MNEKAGSRRNGKQEEGGRLEREPRQTKGCATQSHESPSTLEWSHAACRIRRSDVLYGAETTNCLQCNDSRVTVHLTWTDRHTAVSSARITQRINLAHCVAGKDHFDNLALALELDLPGEMRITPGQHFIQIAEKRIA